MKPFDYLGLIGKDPKQLDPVAKAAWDQMRNFMVCGNPKDHVPNYRNREFWPGHFEYKLYPHQRWVLDNLPKRLKFSWPSGMGKRDSLFETAEKMALHGYMGYPRFGLGDKPRRPKYRTVNAPIQGENSRLFDHLVQRNSEQVNPSFNPYENLVCPGGHIDADDELISPTGRRMVMGFDPAMPILSGGLTRGQLATQYYHGRLPIDPLIIYKQRRLREASDTVIAFDLESDMSLEKTLARMYEYIKATPRMPKTLIDSLGPIRVLDEVPKYRNADGNWVSYTYDPDEWLTQVYTKEREKKYDHKSAVNRVMKRHKFHDKKGTARRLEYIGAGYEENKKAQKPEMVKPTAPLKDYKQFSGRIKRNNP